VLNVTEGHNVKQLKMLPNQTGFW